MSVCLSVRIPLPNVCLSVRMIPHLPLLKGEKKAAVGCFLRVNYNFAETPQSSSHLILGVLVQNGTSHRA